MASVSAGAARRSSPSQALRQRARLGSLAAMWPLALILGMQVIVSLVTLQNTAFQDEGLYLYAGRQILRYWLGGPAPLENYAFYFSGYPYVYPPIGGALDMIGGLELARAFSLACMLGVNIIIYLTARRLFQTPAAIYASAMYAFARSVLFLGRLATYDAFCLFLIALAMGIALRVSDSRRVWLTIFPGPLLVLAMLAKYAALIFVVPVLGIMALGLLAARGWRPMIYRMTIGILMFIAALGVAYLILDKSAYHAIDGSTTNRIPLVEKPRLEMFLHVIALGGLVYAAALLGVIIIWMRSPRWRLWALSLYVASWLMPMYHIYKQETIALDKHIAYGLFFAAPLAGFGVAWLAGSVGRVFADATGRAWLTGLAVIMIAFTLGLQQQGAAPAWANTADLSYVLHTQMRDGSGRYLVEDIEVARYDAEDVTEPWQWNGLQYFYYVDHQGQALLGEPAIAAAIQDHYFALVELSFVAHSYEAHFAARQMIASGNYDLIAKIPYTNTFGSGYFFIFRSALTAGTGDFTSMEQVAPF